MKERAQREFAEPFLRLTHPVYQDSAQPPDPAFTQFR